MCEPALVAEDRLKQRLGQEWIRTTEGVKPPNLQSAPLHRRIRFQPHFLNPTPKYAIFLCESAAEVLKSRNRCSQVAVVQTRALHSRIRGSTMAGCNVFEVPPAYQRWQRAPLLEHCGESVVSDAG